MDSSSISKSPSKMVDVVNIGKEVSSEEEETHKGKCQHIVAIKEGSPRENDVETCFAR